MLKFTQPFAHISMLASEALHIAVLLDHPDFPDLLKAPNQMEPLPQPSRPLGPPDLSNLTDRTDFSDLTDLSDHPYFPDLLNAPDLTDPLPPTFGIFRTSQTSQTSQTVGPYRLSGSSKRIRPNGPPPPTFRTSQTSQTSQISQT